ncbi:MAG: ABC transporter substrate-binding protein [Bacteroidales bacterium]
MRSSKIKAIYSFIIPVFILFYLMSCGHSDKGFFTDKEKVRDDGINHARGFETEDFESHRILRVFNPWQGAVNQKFEYILAGRTAELPDSFPEATVIRTPVNSVICLSTTHIAMLDFIGETEKITAVSGSQYIYNESIRGKIENGELPDIGYDMNLDHELILELNPDIIFAYGVGAESRSYVERLQSLGMDVVLIGEYLEHSPLAQAEWVKFFAHFFERIDFATEKFAEVEDEYNLLSEMTRGLERRPLILTGLPWRESWFVPGGGSLLAELISDAGGEYLFGSNKGRENFPVDLEKVFSMSSRAEYWINTGTALSMRDIEKTDPRLAGLPPFRNNSVFNNNARTSDAGGNDFWESGIVNPHLVLKDLIKIIHPEILETHQLIYYHKL